MVHTNYQFGRINARENTKPSGRALIVERTRIAQKLKNECQKRRRLLEKTRTLSVGDLLWVAMAHSDAQATAAAKAEAVA